MRSRLTAVLAASAATLLAGNLAAATAASSAPAAAASTRAPGAAHTSPAGVALPAPVSQTPVSYTPNLSGGGSGSTACTKTVCQAPAVYSTVVVNGEVVVAGSFAEACTPADTGFAQCPTTTPADFIMAFNPATGAIDQDFAPTFDQGPVNALAAGPGNTVYAGGAFTTVNGVAEQGVVQLNVTPGQSGDGQVVTPFTGYTDGPVTNLAVNGNSLYVGGSFDSVDGTSQPGIARLNATSGALDTSFGITLGDQISGTTLQVQAMALTPDGGTLAIGGSFQTVNGQAIPRVALINTGGGVGSAATVEDWTAPVLGNNCYKQHNYVNAIDFSPDGSFFVLDTTGYKTAGGAAICDAVARFETDATGTDIQPTWVNYSGGDSFHSVAITGNVVYAGGHNRWISNECGSNRWCEANALLVNGLTALDASTGVALAWWHPGTSRGVGVSSLTPFAAGTFAGSDGGLLVGTDVDSIGGATHDELAMFPMTTTTTPAPGGPIQSGMFSDGRIGGTESTTNGTAAMCVDEAGDSSASGTKVDLSTCNNSLEQNWTIGSGDTIQINGLCLDTLNGATKSGTVVVADTCDGDTSQEWVPGAAGSLVNQASDLCLNDPKGSTVSPTQLQIHACNGEAEESFPLPVAQAPPAPPPTGTIFSQLVQENTDVPCVYDYKGETAAGTPVVLSTCEMNPPENWTIESDGTIQFKRRCLDTSNPGAVAGSMVVLDPCDGASSQTWSAGSTYSIVDQASGLCLTDPGSNPTNGTQLQIQDCSGTKDQQWHLPVT